MGDCQSDRTTRYPKFVSIRKLWIFTTGNGNDKREDDVEPAR